MTHPNPNVGPLTVGATVTVDPVHRHRTGLVGTVVRIDPAWRSYPVIVAFEDGATGRYSAAVLLEGEVMA